VHGCECLQAYLVQLCFISGVVLNFGSPSSSPGGVEVVLMFLVVDNKG
jgi:hypothetical protein